jgi:hypothetical protein
LRSVASFGSLRSFGSLPGFGYLLRSRIIRKPVSLLWRLKTAGGLTELQAAGALRKPPPLRTCFTGDAPAGDVGSSATHSATLPYMS